MYQRPKCPYLYFLSGLEFNFRVLFPCEYPEGNVMECNMLNVKMNHDSSYIRTIHLVPMQNFPKKLIFLPPDTHTLLRTF